MVKLKQGETKIYYFGDKKYEIQATSIGTDYIKIEINGESASLPSYSQSYFVFEDGERIELVSYTDKATATFCFEQKEQKCVDSDGGMNYNQKGNVSGICISSIPNKVDNATDFCVNSNVLSEFYCIDSRKWIRTNINCPYGCLNGRCITPNQTTSCPLDTACNSFWPTTEGQAVNVNGGSQPSCNLIEVCNPKLDAYVIEAENFCMSDEDIYNQEIYDGLSKEDRLKKCKGLYIIDALGKNKKFMKGYFTPEICCSGSENDPVVKSHCKNNSYYGLCDSEEDPISEFTSSARQLTCEPFIPQLFWTSDENISKNTCNLITPPAHAIVDILKTGTCEDYSVVLTTLLRKAGYTKEEVMSVAGFKHVFNLVKFPRDKKYHFVDTTGNGNNIAENVIQFGDTPLGKSRVSIDKHVEVSKNIFLNIIKADEMDIRGNIYYDYCKLPINFCYNDEGMFDCPNASQIYGCDKQKRYYLDYCRWRGGIIKSSTCDECWYEIKDSSVVQGCCRVYFKVFGIKVGRKTSCMDLDLNVILDYT
ncbi:hypothetical protein DRN73_06455 [Candidatus Pacearchaeota archaeon]|nr:MAG: hypothetical protein DRN73_06455 [Candidatus Pacearchaeota archaeon]